MSMLTATHTVSLGHRLPSYDGVCSSPHGHNARFSIDVWTESFYDFKTLANVLRDILADFDHAMILHADDPFLVYLAKQGFRYVAMNVEPTTEAMTQLVFNAAELFVNDLPDRRVSKVTMFETDRYSASIGTSNSLVWRVTP
jgi:6-pyruvoyl-tetrahydropterin synthase